MTVRGSVKVGDRAVPPGTECLCVSRHVPTYAHVLPYELPDGYLLYLCPNTFHAVKTLVGIYEQVEGLPPHEMTSVFSVVAQRLAKLHYRIKKEGTTTERLLAVEKLNRLKRD